MYAERYDNHFLKLQASREVLAEFAKFTVEALEKPGLDPLLTAQHPALRAAYTAFSKGVSGRTSSSGQSQTGTRTEEEAATDFIKHVKVTDTRLIQPYLLEHASEEATFYPHKLGGLTQAAKAMRLTRYAAYAEALTQHKQESIQAAGATAQRLLEAYTEATTLGNQSDKALLDTIASLAPGFQALAEALWQVHCAALYVHRAAPKQARTYFAYDRLPNRNIKPKKKPASPKASAEATADL
ncbi:hypothetical protein [Hymenobacter chitinivorans]|uniref:Uncharacterized protein n=1 Tax=Hymenobacter chitinivorans DSM 11115 TaxID=1121954 RepID=A0A2M9B9W8_9BACT|nr:hypothetical protein [Hymenobacter chitinivorans]PJJ54725.1 hypothetical protein CLV45_3071 [Hymenobacter chitinivorans DSM 11115]